MLTEPPKNNFPKLIYGFLIFIIVFLLFAIWNTFTASPQQRHSTYGTLSVWILLMFNLLAFQIPLKPIATATLRILAMLWTIVVFALVFMHYTK